MSVDQFFMDLWFSAAETLPEDPIDDVTVLGAEPDVPSPESSKVPVSEHIPHWDPQCSLMDELASLGSGAALRPKFIQHQRLIDLWWQYLAWAAERLTPM